MPVNGHMQEGATACPSPLRDKGSLCSHLRNGILRMEGAASRRYLKIWIQGVRIPETAAREEGGGTRSDLEHKHELSPNSASSDWAGKERQHHNAAMSRVNLHHSWLQRPGGDVTYSTWGNASSCQALDEEEQGLK